MTRPLALALSLLAAPAWAECIRDPDLRVIDGDTVELYEDSVRLAGFDTPETFRPRCVAERRLSERATARLRGLLESHDAILCLPGTTCGRGRPCGVLMVLRGGYTLDVGSILISEGLAVPFTGSLGSWCE